MRYTSLPLPAEVFVPGSLGNAAQREELDATVSKLDEHQTWLYGVDLFNSGFYWEAHEAWERLWRSAPATSPERDLVKGLIQLAAGLLKLNMGNEPAARRLLKRGTELLRNAQPSLPHYRGLRVETLLQTAHPQVLESPRPRPLQLALEFAPSPPTAPEST